ncbi:hypothetical protein [Moraxella pluranimalium]|uniref:hypothetical protein n=1 Tax=Moraxella pluranimalium TaxID=470453 RepID=UPI0013015C68|nr:hypothetical protein [Moraxella pluranimalium]
MKRLSIVSGIILVAPLVLSACATTGNHTAKPGINCQAPNWQALGEQDGKAGRYAYEISHYQMGSWSPSRTKKLLHQGTRL